MSAVPHPAPVACALNRDDLAVRAERWRVLAERAGQGRSLTKTGLRLSFSAAPGVADELHALAALERDCCAFATWVVEPARNRLVLDVSADGEVAVGAVQALFEGLLGPEATS
jgi:hypothetical protein